MCLQLGESMANPLNNISDRDEAQWFVMSAYKREKEAEQVLSGEGGLEFYIAKHYVIRTIGGVKKKLLVPYIPNIIFVHASHTDIIQFKEKYNFLRFVMWKKSTGLEYLIVPDEEMLAFIKLSSCYEKSVKYHKPNDVNIKKGTRVRIHGGQFDGVEGTYVKLKGKRKKEVVVIVPEILAVSVEVEADYLEIIS